MKRKMNKKELQALSYEEVEALYQEMLDKNKVIVWGIQELLIYTNPIELNAEEVRKKQSIIKYLDDKKIIIKHNSFSIIEFILGTFALFLFYFFYFIAAGEYVDGKIEQTIQNTYTNRQISLEEKQNIELYQQLGEERFRKLLLTKYRYTDNKAISMLFSISMLGFGFGLIYLSLPKNKYFLFDRENGLLTYPGFGVWKKITVPFSTVRFQIARIGTKSFEKPSLAILHPNRRTRSFINYHHNLKEWISLYVWYMDKNRPLPPGSAFDPYRQADFERRKKEGFPHPLFNSEISTPEMTEKQEKERNKV
ncbi:MAG: hypothetical protein LUE98_04105 [Tannerellaceae bacterium]|nr:hypothetical protein [Tannerellaceae bacterium]